MYAKKILKQNAYTLFEVILATVIVAILASLAIPKYTTTLERAKLGEGLQILESLLKAQNGYFFSNGAYTANIADLDVEISNNLKYFENPTIAVNDPIASLDRKDSLYTISIATNGDITCTPADKLCERIGCRAPSYICK